MERVLDRLDDLTGVQKLCIRMLGLTLIGYLIRHYSPGLFIDWSHDLDSPLWTTIFGNNPYFLAFHKYPIDRVWPVIALIASGIYVWFMYDIADHFAQKQLTNNEKGFTLVECMVVVAIIGILSSISIMHFNSATYKHRAVVSLIRSKLQLAKMEAVKTRQPITFATNIGSIDIYIGTNYHNTINLEYGAIIDSPDIPLDTVGAKTPPKVVPQSVMDKCTPPTPIAECTALIDYLHGFEGRSYPHVTVFDPRGLVKKGYGEYRIYLKNEYIPIIISMAGSIHIGNKNS